MADADPTPDFEDALANARNALPHPVARAVRTLQLTHAPKDQYEALLDAAEILAVTVSVTAAALIQGRSEGTASDSRQAERQVRLSALRTAYLTRGGATFGTWTTWLTSLQPLADADPDLVPGLSDALRDRPGAPGLVWHLNVLREERNRAAHGNKPKSQPESALRVREYTRHLGHAVAKARFLHELPWLLIAACTYQPRVRTFEVIARDAMGDHPDFGRRTFTWDYPVGDDLFYVLGPHKAVPLSPFVAHSFCPQCRQTEICYLSRAGRTQGAATLKSFDRGHQIEVAELGEEVRSLPEQQRRGGNAR